MSKPTIEINCRFVIGLCLIVGGCFTIHFGLGVISLGLLLLLLSFLEKSA